jgi:hypothetical protein
VIFVVQPRRNNEYLVLIEPILIDPHRRENALWKIRSGDLFDFRGGSHSGLHRAELLLRPALGDLRTGQTP